MSDSIRLSIPTMKCDSCVSAIEKSLINEVGLSNIQVDLTTKIASFDSDVPVSEPVASLKAIGYEATEVYDN